MKRKINLILSFLLILVVSITIIPQTVNAEEIPEEIPEEIIDMQNDTVVPTDDADILESSNEVTEYFKNNIMPWILTALAGFSGSGIISLVMAFFITSIRKKAQKDITDAGNQLGLAKDSTDKLNATCERLIDAIKLTFDSATEDFTAKIEATINEKLKSFNISADDIIKSREEQQALAKELLNKVGDKLENKEQD